MYTANFESEMSERSEEYLLSLVEDRRVAEEVIQANTNLSAVEDHEAIQSRYLARMAAMSELNLGLITQRPAQSGDTPSL